MGPADLREQSKPANKESWPSPTVFPGYGGLAQSLFFLDRFPEAENTLQSASERKLENPAMLLVRYNIAMLKGDQNQMDRIVALAKGKHALEHRLAHAEALALARSGRLPTASTVIQPRHGYWPCKRA